MYFDGGMEKIFLDSPDSDLSDSDSEPPPPRVMVRGGREGTVLVLKQREPLMALLSDGRLPLYVLNMAKNESLII